VTTPPALIRPSQLARFWELNARTLHIWIREGRLLAIRSPGNHFRLRVADVLAFCEREGLPEILALGVRAPHFDAIAAIRALKSTPATTSVVVVALDVPSRTQATALERAGAARAIVSGQTSELLPVVLGELLGPLG
jgi:excisionase family DNA binding protein